MIKTEIEIKNGNALNNAKDDNLTRGYKLSCLISTENGIEVLYGVNISYLRFELDSFIILILYPNGKYKIAGIFGYEDLYNDKIEEIFKIVYSELENEINHEIYENIFALLCTMVNQVKYVRTKVDNMTNAQLISAKEASKLYGISCDAARAFIKTNGGTKYGREWMLAREVFEEHYK